MPTKGQKAMAARPRAGQQPAIELAETAKKGMGFKKAAQGIARKRGVPYDRAAAILASSTRKASPAAKRANPNLKKVNPAKKSSGKKSK